MTENRSHAKNCVGGGRNPPPPVGLGIGTRTRARLSPRDNEPAANRPFQTGARTSLAVMGVMGGDPAPDWALAMWHQPRFVGAAALGEARTIADRNDRRISSLKAISWRRRFLPEWCQGHRLGSRRRESSINQLLRAESKLLRCPQAEENVRTYAVFSISPRRTQKWRTASRSELDSNSGATL